MPSPDQPVEMLCRYRLKPGKEREFTTLLARHWPTLHAAGLATAAPARVLRGEDKAGNVAFFETFAWKNGKSAGSAHESAEVMRLWEPMGALCEDMEFWNVQEIDPQQARS